MTFTVTWEPDALDQAAGFLKDDPAATRALIHATDGLADDPRPAGSTAWGADHRRLRHERRRVLYRIDDANDSIHIEHVGRVY